jgi:hypothetical protein
MADEADRAENEIEAGLQEALWRARQQVKGRRTVFETCYCGLADGIRFCSPACRDEHDSDRRLKDRAGR